MFTGKCAFLKLAKSPKNRSLRITFAQFIGSTSYLEKILYIALHYDRGTGIVILNQIGVTIAKNCSKTLNRLKNVIKLCRVISML